MKIDISKSKDHCRIPEKKHEHDAGADLYTINDVMVPARSRVKVNVGFKVDLPVGYEMQIRPRSGMSAEGMEGTKEVPTYNANGELNCKLYRFDADVCFGTIDCGYKGDVHVIVANHDNSHFFIPRGTRIAQCVIAKHEEYEWVVVDEISQENDRGGGLGHTGTR